MPTTLGVPSAQKAAANAIIRNTGTQTVGGDQTALKSAAAQAGGQSYAQAQAAGQQAGLSPYDQAKMQYAQTNSFSQNADVYQQQGLAKAADFKAQHDAWQQREDKRQADAQAAADAAAKAAEQAKQQSNDPGTYLTNLDPASSNNDARNQIIKAAEGELGTPYAWGGGGYGNSGSRGIGLGTTNVIGVDCSGLTSYAYGTVGVKLPRYSKSQLTMGYRTSIKNLQPGDLVGWTEGNGVKGHVALYIGNGQIIESPHPGTTVRVRKLYSNEGAFGVHIKMPGE
jgi:cell wall-associated NlpC family hydrolase